MQREYAFLWTRLVWDYFARVRLRDMIEDAVRGEQYGFAMKESQT